MPGNGIKNFISRRSNSYLLKNTHYCYKLVKNQMIKTQTTETKKIAKNQQFNQAKEYFNEANELKEKGMLAESIASCEKAIAIKPNYPQPVLKLAEIYETQENWSEAAKCYRRAVGFNPDNANTFVKLAKALAKQNKTYGAIAAYAEAIELKQDLSAFVYRDYGDLLLQVNDANPDAIAAYQKAEEIKQDWGVSFYNKFANLLEKQEKLAEATTYYLKALSLRGDNPRQYFKVANIYLKQGLLKEAAGNYQKALKLNPSYSNAYKRLGDLLIQKNQLDDAVKCYQKAVQIQPDFKGAYRSLGNVLMEQGKQSEAELCFQKAS